ncbi:MULTISPECIES: hybrid sensor histidine kinase/response regulator [Vibrio]|uniref:hybrid sensor histidine kinase/response regulator n=1 Tax=Vibrio TaxID=662 RepID=UPI0010BE1AF5|nr:MULTISPECIES: hybrid sensor histidine kinase/response regulator [Vibrio]MBS9882490.1 response regulator [Vibrio alginolyticus]MCR9337124.1 ATP-binding protein [Vibrio alginolyticus]MCR9342918.1 ATP-binding protein [Vibrio alginolyticus]MCR9601476.1 ATP-binding protein [Vibrio alginolyticus]MCR9606511.1 ATP-binding protein [Vibrio alginolyticus]
MEIRSSLRKKSILALTLYLCFFIATIGSVAYLVVEPPVRQKLEQNLELRTQLLALEIKEPLLSSTGVLSSLVGLAQGTENIQSLNTIIPHILQLSDKMLVSGGVWPKPELKAEQWRYRSLFFNKNSDSGIDQIHSYNNPESGGYDNEPWYVAAANAPVGSVSWSTVYIDTFTQVQMITASSPYYQNGRFAGVVTVDLSLDALFQFIREHTNQHSLGVVVRDADSNVIIEHNFQLTDEIYVSELDFGEFDWRMEVVNAKAKVADQVFEQVMSVEGRIIPFLLLCVLVGYYLLNRYIVEPIVRIAAKIDDSKTGGIIDIDYDSDDEIGQLIEKFNEKTIYLEQERIKAQASTNAKTAFLATLSHEIRTPMNGVLGTAQILLKTPLTDEQRKHLRTLYDSGDHMMTLLNEILDYSKIEQGHVEFENKPFPIESIIGSIKSVYQTLCAEKGLRFRVVSHLPTGRWYNNDKARLRQVLFNLLNNAVKFTDRGIVEVELAEKSSKAGTKLILKVKDTGIGISKEAQKRIFRPFEQAESSTTRRFGGTGLGLAIVKEIAEHMGGQVVVESQEDAGTTFTVEIALTPCKPGKVESINTHKLNCKGLKALIVEDNRTNAIIMETFLRAKGFECTSVENGQLAVDEVAIKPFDLILMDNHMPVLDGVGAISAIRAMSSPAKSVLIFGCTADVFKETQERMINVGADHIIAKPIVESELNDALYLHATQLYQYQSDFDGNAADSFNAEKWLLNFYVALDNGHLNEALEAISAIIAEAPLELSGDVSSVAERIRSNLKRQQSPDQDDIDTLTILLASP